MPATPTAQRPLLIQAMDHRDSLQRDLYGIPGTPTPQQAARIAGDKLLVFEGLLEAVADLPDDATPGVLVDEEHGASVAALAGRTDGVDLSVPIEASGHPWFTFAFPDDWRTHATVFGNTQVKVLVRDNSGLDAAARAQQVADLAPVSAWAREAGLPLLLELLVPATDGDLARVDGDRARYDTELRPGLTTQVITALQDGGVEPALWKLEGYDTREGAEQVVAAAKRDGRAADCIVLGRHSPKAALDRWLRVAAPVPGFVGFAIGRSIWWDALQAGLGGAAPDEVRRQVAATYLDYARVYLDAR